MNARFFKITVIVFLTTACNISNAQDWDLEWDISKGDWNSQGSDYTLIFSGHSSDSEKHIIATGGGTFRALEVADGSVPFTSMDDFEIEAYIDVNGIYGRTATGIEAGFSIGDGSKRVRIGIANDASSVVEAFTSTTIGILPGGFDLSIPHYWGATREGDSLSIWLDDTKIGTFDWSDAPSHSSTRVRFGQLYATSANAGNSIHIYSVNMSLGVQSDPPSTRHASVLPVEFIKFDIKEENNAATLNWSTAQEVNNMGFEVYKSNDAVKWDKIGFVNGHENSNSIKKYSFADSNSKSGVSYYKLKQIDFDGQYEFSKVISINKIPSIANSLEIYPNPTTDYVKINLGGGNSFTAYLYDSFGRLYLKKDIVSDNMLDLSNIKKGNYILKVATGNKILSKKIVVL